MPSSVDEAQALLLAALEEVAGPAIVLDANLAIVGFTRSAPELVGGDIPLGVPAARVLCGSGPDRPVAEALARGEPVRAEVMRPMLDGQARMIQVRATPLSEDGEARQGWLLLLEADAFTVQGPDAEVDSWGIHTRNAAMKQLLRQIARVAKSNASVLVRGETGSGKELVAGAIHRASPRAEGPFRALNCAALPPSLLESELFGHVRGAFTGAVRDAPGHFRLAHGGTLFLDEIGELPLELQAKLLRVLQERSVIPIGGREPIDVDVRIVAATHRSLRDAVARGSFRADLMYRLRVVPLFLPPLRDRPEDVALLAQHFIEQIGKEQSGKDQLRAVTQLSPGALLALERYAWPGNVRELRNVIEYAVVMGEGVVITDADLPPEILGQEPLVPKVNAGAPVPDNLPEEAKQLLRALERAGGHQGRAAQSLGMSRVTLWRRLRKYGLDRAAEATASQAPARSAQEPPPSEQAPGEPPSVD